MTVYYAYDLDSKAIEEIRPDSNVHGSPSAMRASLGVLLTLIVMGASAFAWTRTDSLIAWGFSQGLVSEASIPSLQVALTYAFIAVGVTSLLFNRHLLVWIAFSICRSGPVRFVAGHATSVISQCTGAITGMFFAGLMVTRMGAGWRARKMPAAGTLLYRAGRLLGSGMQLVFNIGLSAVRSAVAAVFGQIGKWVGWLATHLATGIKASANVAALIIGLATLLVNAIAHYSLTRVVKAVAVVWALLTVASRYLAMPLVKLANAISWTSAKVLSGVGRVLGYAWTVVTAIYMPIAALVLKALRVLYSGCGYAWETAAKVAKICWSTASTSIGYLRTGIGKLARGVGHIVDKVWSVASRAAGLLWTGMEKVFWLAGGTLSKVARVLLTVEDFLWSVVAAATRHTGHLPAVSGRMFGKTAGYVLNRLWVATTWTSNRIYAVTRLLYAGVAAVFKGLGRVIAIVVRGLISILRFGRIGLSRALWYLGIGLSAVSRLIWATPAAVGLGLLPVLRYSASGLRDVARHSLDKTSVALGYLWFAVVTATKYICNRMAIVTHYVMKVLGYVLGQIWDGLGWVFTRVDALVRYALAPASAALGQLGLATDIVGRGMIIAIRFGWLPVSIVLKYIEAGVLAASRLLWAGLAMLGTGLLITLRCMFGGARISTRLLWSGLSAVGAGLLLVPRYTYAGIRTVAKSVSRTAQIALGIMVAGFRPIVKYMALGLRTFKTGVTYIAGVTYLVLAAVVGFLWIGLNTLTKGTGILLYQAANFMGGALASLWLGSRMLIHPLVLSASALISCLRLGITSIYLAAAWTINNLRMGTWIVSKAVFMAPVFATRTAITGFATLPDAGSAGLRMIRNRKGVKSMTDSKVTRERFFSLVVTMLVFFTAGAFALRVLWPAPPPPTVEVVHWATGHLFRNDMLPRMAERFNQSQHRTESGKLIVVKAQNNPSSIQADDLLSRVMTGVRMPRECCPAASTPHPDPTIVTPSSAHWLIRVNQTAGRKVVDPDSSRNIATAYIGIITYRDMAECLGWPEKEIGYQDIIDLRADPQGWKKYDCAKPSWGERPLVAFTDPKTSSTGRSVHLALYSMAAGKLPEDLTLEDVSDPAVVQYVRDFQSLIDHYFIGTTVMNTKIHQGPQFGQFFLMPEDNLIHLYEGTERAYFGGIRKSAPPIAPNSMVMIYPKEGSMARNNCACIVDAPWVTLEEVEGANKWIDFLQEDEQQLEFMDAGFRPATELSLSHPRSKITMSYGLTAKVPEKTMNVALIDPVVADAIDRSWEEVKRPGIVTFVVDTSGSMLGNKLKQAKDGLIRSLDNMASNTQVGYVSFDDAVNTVIPVDHLGINGPRIVDEIRATRARGETALYDAIKVGAEMTDAAQGPADAIRAVVVLTDGRANKGTTELDDIIEIMSRAERPVTQFRGFTGEATGLDSIGTVVGKEHMMGTRLRIETEHPVQIFFIGIGEDADLDVGRLLAGATYAEFQGVIEEDLANLLAEFSGYF